MIGVRVSMPISVTISRKSCSSDRRISHAKSSVQRLARSTLVKISASASQVRSQPLLSATRLTARRWTSMLTNSPARAVGAAYGEALLTAKRPELQPLIDHLAEVAKGRDDIRTECAGILAGSWFSSTARRGEDLIAAGLLMLTGPVDLEELDRWMRVGWERRRGSTVPYPGMED
jgi:hypothetical protein